MEKTYTKPKFEFVKSDGRNRVFFAASGTPGAAPTPGGTLGSMSSTNGAW